VAVFALLCSPCCVRPAVFALLCLPCCVRPAVFALLVVTGSSSKPVMAKAIVVHTLASRPGNSPVACRPQIYGHVLCQKIGACGEPEVIVIGAEFSICTSRTRAPQKSQ